MMYNTQATINKVDSVTKSATGRAVSSYSVLATPLCMLVPIASSSINEGSDSVLNRYRLYFEPVPGFNVACVVVIDGIEYQVDSWVEARGGLGAVHIEADLSRRMK